MESWQKVWREGIEPLLSIDALRVLHAALLSDDPRLIQGANTTPPPLLCVHDWPVEEACVLCYAGWQGEGLETVAEVEEYFARLCFECDQRMGDPAACRWFLNFWDDTPRHVLFPLILEEVNLELLRRCGNEANSANSRQSVAG